MSRGRLQPDLLRADGHVPIRTGSQRRAVAPDIGPPGKTDMCLTYLGKWLNNANVSNGLRHSNSVLSAGFDPQGFGSPVAIVHRGRAFSWRALRVRVDRYGRRRDVHRVQTSVPAQTSRDCRRRKARRAGVLSPQVAVRDELLPVCDRRAAECGGGSIAAIVFFICWRLGDLAK